MLRWEPGCASGMLAAYQIVIPQASEEFAMTDSLLSRRDLLRTAAVSPLWLPVVEAVFEIDAIAQKTAKRQATLEPLNRWPRMVQEWFVKQVREAERKGNERRAAVKTKADAERYVADVRKRIAQSFGLFPKKTPLKPRVTGVVQRDAYHIENVIFESRPGFLVTANLYVPKGRKGKLPGVVGTCGHSNNGKAAGAYQSFAQGLARQGYVVLIYDPIGQGERLQYVDDKLKSKIGVGVREHLHAGNQQFLVGEFLGAWRAWDGIRALDYLLTRKEVDPQRVGVTGNSGGGTMTTWLCGLERRWSMAAPSCFVTTFRRNLENELPADTEQCPPKALALGLDHSDFIAAMAPKPVILLGKEKDFFDVRGLHEAYERLKRLYKLLGAEQNIALFVGPTYHGYSQENREAMYGWFNKATGVSKATKEPALKLEKDETLWCTPRGQVAGLKSRTVFEFTREKAGLLATERKEKTPHPVRSLIRPSLGFPSQTIIIEVVGGDVIVDGQVVARAKSRWDDWTVEAKIAPVLTAMRRVIRPAMRRGASRALVRFTQWVGSDEVRDKKRWSESTLRRFLVEEGLEPFHPELRNERPGQLWNRWVAGSHLNFDGTAPPYRIIRPHGRSRNYPTKYHITYAVETEPGMHAIVTRLSDERLYSRPPRGKKRAVLYVADRSSDDELRNEGLIKSVRNDESSVPFFAVDVRGIGESRPGTAGADPYTNPYGADYFYAVHSLMLDRPYAGQRTHDVLRVLDWLRSVGHTEVHLVARGWGAIPATFAAVLSNQVKQVTLKHALTSFHDVATTEFYDWPLSSFVPNVLASFDLSDCYAALKGKKLKQIEPRGAKT
jgi:dienelactone hydrolase